jgi:anti-sigma regulatory factor (Ser/Thr protein kinase)
VTCLVGVHDASAGTVTFASAGHPPPLRMGAGGDAGYVDVRPGLPLGVPAAIMHTRIAAVGDEPVAPYAETTVPLEPGAALLLFTDGLVEDRDVSVGAGLDRLATAFAGQVPADADGACDAALRAMGRDTSHDDDTAVLVLRALPGPEALTLPDGDGAVVDRPGAVRVGLTSSPQAPALARRAVVDALQAGGLPELADTATLLVSELVTNALRHGGGPRELFVQVDDAAVAVGVRDASPRAPHPVTGEGPGAMRVVDGGLAENGRGLLLVELLADTWGWRPEDGGKLVWFRLRRD